MKRKLTTYLGLALVVAVGAMAAFAAVTFTATPQPAEARVSDSSIGNIAGGPRDSNLIVSAPALTSVTSGTATVSPNDPGRTSRFQIQFITSASGALNPGAEVIITLEDDFQVAIPLSTALITISSTVVTDGGAVNQVVRPDGVAVSLVGPENNEAEIRLTVPDMDTSDTAGGAGGDGIGNSATVTVVFQQGSGITNPSEAGNYELFIKTTADVDALELDGPTGVNIRPRSRPRSR